MRKNISVMIGAAVFAVTALLTQNANAADTARGKALYDQSCSSCHGADGKGGMPGVPDLTVKKGVLSQADAVLIDRITNGYQSADSPMGMPPKGGNASLSKDDIDAILAYMHKAFGVPGK